MAYAITSAETLISVVEGKTFYIDLRIQDITSVSLSYSVFTVAGTAAPGLDYVAESSSGSLNLSYWPIGNYELGFDFRTLDNDDVTGRGPTA